MAFMSRVPAGGEDAEPASEHASTEEFVSKESRRGVAQFSLDAVHELSTETFMLTSPRSLKALKHCALKVEQLQHRPLSQFKSTEVPLAVAKLSFEGYEQKRRERLALVKKEYHVICR
jgi:hypothetical protein